MKLNSSILEKLSAVLMAVALCVLAAAVILSGSEADGTALAGQFERKVESRLSQLEKYVSDPSARKLPDDMVIYRYVNDTLKNWTNQFPVKNDDVVEPLNISGPEGPRTAQSAPLSKLTDAYSYLRLGSRSYLVKSEKITTQSGERRQTVSGLEISAPSGEYSIVPLSAEEGATVKIRGLEQFKIVKGSSAGSDSRTSTMAWAALLLFLLSGMLYLKSHPTLGKFVPVLLLSYASLALMYVWGLGLRGDIPIFSPLVFAAGPLLYSIGALSVLNLAIVLLCVGIYFTREDIVRRFGSHTKLLTAAVLAASAALFAYIVLGFRSVVRNSDIPLDLYKIGSLTAYSALVYTEFIAVLFCVPLLVRIIRPGRISHLSRALYSLAAGVILVVITSVLGLSKEKARLEIWANQLYIDRDIALELQLCRSESRIEDDPIIASLTTAQNAGPLLEDYIVEHYFFRVSQDYNVSVFVYKNYERDERAARFFSENIQGGEPVSKDSRFLYSGAGNGLIRYTGVFMYFNQDLGYTSMLLRVEAKTDREETGYASILGLTPPGTVNIPAEYSCARYSGRALNFFKGSYAYPTIADDKLYWQMYLSEASSFTQDGFTHFVTRGSGGPSTEEAVIISRPSVSFFNYLIAALFIALLVYVIMSIFNHLAVDSGPAKVKSYYRARLTYVLTTSLTVTLVVMMTVSVIFVYRRNDANLHLMMSDKINSVRTLVENELRAMPPRPGGLNPQDIRTVLQSVSASTSTDITMYTPQGHVLVSTVPEVFDRMMLGSRIDEVAFEQINTYHKRYYVHKERLADKEFYSMYAPLFDDAGQIKAIICSPYADDSFDFEKDALLHAFAVIVVFLILLLMSRLMSRAVVDKLFLPLSEMARKMKQTDINNLEKIEYDRDDEILALVNSYNWMVDCLADSSEKLAQAERDKTVTGMARQVAHEVKNPLTPMKLQIQRLIRLKERGDASWADKFDEVSQLLLEHIDILTEISNEFAALAKLPTEESTEIDLDDLIRKGIAMFEVFGTDKFEYIGLEKAMVMGPRPQLTRVITNLLTNAVQALSDTPDARIFISLRNADDSAYYNITVEDNGPGVSPENIGRLFNSSFTTKSSGSGLGLAISRSVLERCSASISYCKSFALGGACFVIKYPKKGN